METQQDIQAENLPKPAMSLCRKKAKDDADFLEDVKDHIDEFINASMDDHKNFSNRTIKKEPIIGTHFRNTLTELTLSPPLSSLERPLMMTTISRDLPMDLVEEILCYVPATHLNQFRSTCKRWNHLLNGDSRFLRKHTDKAAKQFLVLMVKLLRLTIVNLIHGSVEFKSELSLIDSQSMYSAQFDIDQVIHCDGLLLCTSRDYSRFVVWNPLTGETRWFQSSTRGYFFLGYYQKDNNKSYKILSIPFAYASKDNEIYEFSSELWRTLDDIIAPGRGIADPVSLKGNTYWFDDEDGTKNISLLKFDFQTEKSVHVPFPFQCHYFSTIGISVVREEKLSVLLQRDVTSKTEIWVTNKVDETTTQVVSWSKVLALDLNPDLQICDAVNFLLDEEKKVVMMCVRWVNMRWIPWEVQPEGKDMLYTVGEDGEVTEVEVDCLSDDRGGTSILNYVPSLVQIEQAGSRMKRKRDNL